MFDLLLFAILFALVFLAAHQESIAMLSFGLLGAYVGKSAHVILLSQYPWWTVSMGYALVICCTAVGMWGVGHRQERASFMRSSFAGIGAAGLLTVILLPFLVSIFGRALPLSPYAHVLFLGSVQELAWTLGAFVVVVVSSRVRG